MRTTIFVTGITGFLGRSLCETLLQHDVNIRAVVRSDKAMPPIPAEVERIVVGDISHVTDWAPLLDGVDVVVHLAARVHQMREGKIPPNPPFAKGGTRDQPLFAKGGMRDQPLFEKGGTSENLYQKINVDVTRTLAEACNKAGVKRFVFVSSVKAVGELTEPGEVWNESTPCMPQDAYGKSKLAAEKVLTDMGKTTGLEVVILRFPLVYGPGVKANMARLIKLVKSGIPLPFGSVKNHRSLLHVGNAADAIRICVKHPAAAGETFLVDDGKALSTPDLIRHISRAYGRSTRLFPFPTLLFHLAGKVLGQSGAVDRLLGSLVVDSSKIRHVLSWQPPYGLEEGMRDFLK